MATRDLTAEFMECRKRRHVFNMMNASAAERERDNAGLLDDDPTTPDSWRLTLPPKWVDAVDQVEEDIRDMDAKMEQLKELHAKRLMVSFDDSESDKEREIEALSHSITGLFRRSEATLRRNVAGGDGGSDARVRSNIQRSLAKKLQERSMKLRQLQKTFMSKLHQQKNGGNVSELDFLTQETGKGSRGRQQQTVTIGFNQQQLQVVDNMEDIVNERDEEITRIAKSIEELSQIFKELAVLVIDQGTILDRIDFNMEQVVERTQEGLVQLNKAEKYQKSARPIKCIALLLVLIVIMLTILILKHKQAR